ncbi:cupin domain-containing protein [Chachezhania antarctica]|uniref:cupin domain-containing protein n=1 Tax=Chachezhania antarctica TaxID=2340860 RepID=UPI000EAD5E71|nr:cupin domain-containing protein [Chachezhania antarctica]|tara:strand:- start:745 stop:1902 length:1158 start_codon:yes stop_codon:yes gene_type:complete
MTDAAVKETNAGSNRDAALAGLYEDVANKHMFPFWATTDDVTNDEVRQLMATAKALPYKWSYADDIEPLLRLSAKLISMDDSERRSLILCNPGLKPRRASVSTMYTAYRLNDPNEIMPPHKHSPSAIRFGLTGKGNFTGVAGEDITFGPGDMVLTPNDAWHNHGTIGDEEAVNLSVLDLPLIETLNAIHFDHEYTEIENGVTVKKRTQTANVPDDYSQAIYGAGGMTPRWVDHYRGGGLSSPMYVYRWERMLEIFDRFRDVEGDPHEALMVEYTDPTRGEPVFKTITFFAQMLRPGEKTLPLRQTASLLVAPFEGKGHSIIDGERFDWNAFDTLAVPGGAWCEHHNDSDTDPVYMFVASDEPTLKKLALYKSWGQTADGDITRLL